MQIAQGRGDVSRGLFQPFQYIVRLRNHLAVLHCTYTVSKFNNTSYAITAWLSLVVLHANKRFLRLMEQPISISISASPQERRDVWYVTRADIHTRAHIHMHAVVVSTLAHCDALSSCGACRRSVSSFADASRARDHSAILFDG